MAPGQTGDAPRCFLLDLPPELRLRVYDYIYVQPLICHLTVVRHARIYRHQFFLEEDVSHPCQVAALMKTCKITAQEATPILFDTVTFVLDFQHTFQEKYPVDHAFLKHARRIDIYIRTFMSSAVATKAEAVRAVCQSLSNHHSLCINDIHVEMAVPGEFIGVANPIVRAMKGLRSQKPPTATLSADLRDVSENVWEEFVKEIGVVGG